MGKVIVGGLATEYKIRGKGPNVVLIHGWGDNLKTFKSLESALANKYTVISLDLPGFGQTDTPKEAYTLKKYALFISEFLDKIDIKHIFAFVGHSNGGAIALRGLSSGVLVSDKLILLASSGVRSIYKTKKKIIRMAVKTAKIPTLLLPSSTRNKIRKRVYKKIGSDMFVAENMQETFKNVITEDIVHESAMIQQPTLLIYGSADKSTPPEFGQKFHKLIEDSELRIIEGADHFLHHTHQKEVDNLVLEYLDK